MASLSSGSGSFWGTTRSSGHSGLEKIAAFQLGVGFGCFGFTRGNICALWREWKAESGGWRVRCRCDPSGEPGEWQRRPLGEFRLNVSARWWEYPEAMSGQKHQRKMRPLRIDCAEENWKVLLKRNLQEGIEVDLDNLDYNVDGVLCEVLAMAHSMTLRYSARSKSWLFKKPAAGLRVL